MAMKWFTGSGNTAKALMLMVGAGAWPAWGAQGTVYKFWVELKDKVGSTHSILRPSEFLSERAILRRKKAGIPVTTEDLPVSPQYIRLVADSGVRVLHSSRWMNALLIEVSDSAKATAISRLTPVKSVSLLGKWSRKRGPALTNPDAFGEMEWNEEKETIAVKNRLSDIPWNNGYGMGYDQIRQLHGEWLHSRGYRGRGMLIAVLDAGFYRANRLAAFDSLFRRRGVLLTRDFVDGDASVYNDDDHGTQVLSCMAANVPGVMVGTAPDAGYILLRTEDAGSEFPVEEANWLIGAEFADSMGADVINSSLGYTEFDMESLSHRYSDLDGETTLITRAANMAGSRGILVVNSAGNEGDGSWKYIGAPADAAGVIAVAAVDKYGRRAGFSSLGPTADRRVKPDLAAMGERTVVASPSGYFVRSNGTSFSAPVLAGMMACAMQYMQDKTAGEVRKVVTLSASGFPGGNAMTGYGIPDFSKLSLIVDGPPADTSLPRFIAWPDQDTVYTAFALKTAVRPAKSWTYKLSGPQGGVMASGTLDAFDGMIFGTVVEPGQDGNYELEVGDGKQVWKKRFYYSKSEQDEYEE